MNTSTPREAQPGTKRDWLAFDRSDRVGLALLMVLVALGAAVTWLVRPLVEWAGGDALAVPFFSKVEVPGLAGTGLGHRGGRYDLLVPDPTTGQRLLDLLPGLGYLAIVVVAGYLLLRIMGDIGRGDPFRPHNVRRLRGLAALVALGWPIVFFAELTCRFTILTGLDLGDLGPRAAFDLPVVPVLVGTTIALVAEAFKAGSRLRDDVDGLV
jgi:hypothetical protein